MGLLAVRRTCRILSLDSAGSTTPAAMLSRISPPTRSSPLCAWQGRQRGRRLRRAPWVRTPGQVPAQLLLLLLRLLLQTGRVCIRVKGWPHWAETDMWAGHMARLRTEVPF